MEKNIKLPQLTYKIKLVNLLKKNRWLIKISKRLNVSRNIEIFHIRNELNKSRSKYLLDIGCGDGFWTNDFSKFCTKAIGIDPFSKDLEIANKYRHIQFTQGIAEKLPFQNCHFDTVVSVCVFEHLIADQQAFKEIHRVLQPGGKLFATVDSLNHPVISDKMKKWHCKKWLCNQTYSSEELTLKLASAGFQNIKTYYIITNKVSIIWEIFCEKIGFLSFLLSPIVFLPLVLLEKRSKNNYGYKLFVNAEKL